MENLLKSFCLILFVISYKSVESSENGNSISLRNLLQLNKYYYNNCPNREKEWMTQCDMDAAADWNIYEGQQDISSRSYCCYIWDQLRCKLKIARNCDNNYAIQLERDTEQQYNSVCYYHSRRSASCALRWWSIMLIVIGGLIIVALVSFFVWRRYQNKYTSRYDY